MSSEHLERERKRVHGTAEGLVLKGKVPRGRVYKLAGKATRSRGCCPPEVAMYLQIPAEEPQGQLIVVGSRVYGECQTCSTRGPKLGRLAWAFSCSVGARHIGGRGESWTPGFFEGHFTLLPWVLQC